MLAWWGSGEDSPPGLQMAAFSLCPHMQRESSALVSPPLLIRAPVLLDQHSALMPSFNLNLLLNGPFNTVTCRGWGFDIGTSAWHDSVHSRWAGQTIYGWYISSTWLPVWSEQSRRKGVVVWAFFPKPHLFSDVLLQLMTSYPDVDLFSHCWSWWVLGLASIWGEVGCFGLGLLPWFGADWFVWVFFFFPTLMTRKGRIPA